MDNRRKISDIAIGDTIKGDIFRLDELSKADGGYKLLLSDKTGEIRGFIPTERYVTDYGLLLNGAVIVNGAVLVGNEGEPLIKIRSMAHADNDAYKASEIFMGLTDDKIREYIDFIGVSVKKLITDDDVRALVVNTLTSDMLSKLSALPASIAYHGKYMGGALASTAAVTRMVAQTLVAYKKSDNGLYSIDYDWSILIAASCLHMIGIPDYITMERPWRYTDSGLSRGYMSLVQERLESVRREKNLKISEDKFSKILNIIACSVPRKSGIRAVTPEGRVFRATLLCYEEMDQLACAVDGTEFDEGKSYDYLRGVGYIQRPGGGEGVA